MFINLLTTFKLNDETMYFSPIFLVNFFLNSSNEVLFEILRDFTSRGIVLPFLKMMKSIS